MRIMGWVGASLLLLFIVVAIIAPFIAPYSPTEYSGLPLENPGHSHPLGTNHVGQDIVSQLIYGTRISLVVSFTVALTVIIVGGGIGLLAGVNGGFLDRGVMRVVDVVLAIPHLPLMLLLSVYFPPEISSTILILSLVGWPMEARLIRNQVSVIKYREYLEAASMFGAGRGYIIWRYLIRELAPLLFSQFIMRVSWAVLTEAGLAFLGLGDPALKSWGAILRQAVNYPAVYFTALWQWWILPAGICITILVLSLTMLGMALEEQFNPKLKGVV